MAAAVINCVILGGGGHARVLVDTLLASGGVVIAGILDRDPGRVGSNVLGVEVIGGDEALPLLAGRGVTHFLVGLGGTGDNSPRRRLFDLGIAGGLKPLSVLHKSAIVSSFAALGEGCQLLPGCIVNAGSRIGRNAIINSGAIVEHDCEVGDHVHVATGAILASTVRIGDCAHVGAGAVVRQCISIGRGAIVGAGAVVVKDVKPGDTVAGVPAEKMG